MNLAESQKLIASQIGEESLFGIFEGIYTPPLRYFWFIGPLAFIAQRQYIIAMTDKAIHINRIDAISDELEMHNSFPYNHVHMGFAQSLILMRPMLVFHLPYGRTLRLRIADKSRTQKANSLGITEELKEFITQRSVLGL